MPKFEREVEINVPIEKVWDVLIDPNHWPDWFPGMDSVSNVTPVTRGASIDWTSGDQKGRATIVKMEPGKYLEVMTQVGDDQDSHVFKLRPSGGFFGLNNDECKIEYTLDTLMGGGFLGSFIAGGNPKDLMKVKNAMNMFRKLVESL